VHPTSERLKQPGGLAERLFAMRRAAGLTGARLAADLGWAPSKVSKIENGNQTPSADDIRAWAGACGHPEAVDELLDILADVQTISRRWKQRARGGLAPIQEDYDRRTREAKRVRNAEILIMPGLLQTAGYARGILAKFAAHLGVHDLDEAVAARMRRQEVLYDTDKTFEFVITEAALRTLVVPAQVMAGQLDRLLSLGLANVTLGIIPFGVELGTPPAGGLLMLDDAAIVETDGVERNAGEEESAEYDQIFGRLMAESVTGDEARRLIAAAAVDLRLDLERNPRAPQARRPAHPRRRYHPARGVQYGTCPDDRERHGDSP
jgi:transcriptional regulator with XRE-family HTH domain